MKYITKTQWETIKANAIEAMNDYPFAYRRVRAKVYFNVVAEGINKFDPVNGDIVNCVEYIYCRTVNFGTRTWPCWINTVEEFNARDVIKETKKTYRLSYGNSYLLKDNVVAIVVEDGPEKVELFDGCEIDVKKVENGMWCAACNSWVSARYRPEISKCPICGAAMEQEYDYCDVENLMNYMRTVITFEATKYRPRSLDIIRKDK